ncbi:GIY-YIG nuclease family protein [Paraburkholderia flagellata]|uniref:GIY-YIG nuclease family protein n=1 Tax=Paraburkholderia flagellata TaxID=2883241 RepID=UPI001F243006|nr:GIY-YIG nuclease family protein [Paraburkholderia flagellata]
MSAPDEEFDYRIRVNFVQEYRDESGKLLDVWRTPICPTLANVEDELAIFNAEFSRPKTGVLVLSEPYRIVEDAHTSFPNSSYAGVYFMFDRIGRLLYIGQSAGLGTRIGSHFGWNENRTAGVAREARFQEVHHIRTIGLPPENAFEAPAIELWFIQRLNPPLNDLHARSRTIISI